MKGITYSELMTPEEYNDLRVSVDWREITPGQAKRGLENTTFLTVARDDEKIIGMGRVLFDYGYTAYIGDVIIRPEYQGQGIGSHIVKSLMDKTLDAACEGDRIMFILGAAKGKEEFYEKFGFKMQPNEYSGHGMSMYKVKK
jgi:predicted GNAT family N-acyltransferase